jgi:hypothetical protein
VSATFDFPSSSFLSPSGAFSVLLSVSSPEKLVEEFVGGLVRVGTATKSVSVSTSCLFTFLAKWVPHLGQLDLPAV